MTGSELEPASVRYPLAESSSRNEHQDDTPLGGRCGALRWAVPTGLLGRSRGRHRRHESRGITRLVLGGVATSIGVESTAREAHDLGYELVIASDAVIDLRPETHQNSLERIFPMLAKVATTTEILAAIDG
ncbi:isochorismatase family protein [Agromyces mariniharenae]|uniref:Isochorismatase family protein n=1 Tax=Agromyces mariniharenae TaxID=2604423 RepID=A0A5S4VC01_9MICO|nr:isochorismatase family protein [Agromyces mariniharenae]TYL54180.1 isochorismatase family protein [Agromyces mariniharenae]